MTKSAKQLWWDKDFIEQRIKEQLRYIENIPAITRYITNSCTYRPRHDYTPRNKEIADSAEHILKRFERQLEKIKQLK